MTPSSSNHPPGVSQRIHRYPKCFFWRWLTSESIPLNQSSLTWVWFLRFRMVLITSFLWVLFLHQNVITRYVWTFNDSIINFAFLLVWFWVVSLETVAKNVAKSGAVVWLSPIIFRSIQLFVDSVGQLSNGKSSTHGTSMRRLAEYIGTYCNCCDDERGIRTHIEYSNDSGVSLVWDEHCKPSIITVKLLGSSLQAETPEPNC